MNERLNKVLADLGYGSRRSIDRQISAGIVCVNDKVAVLGQRVNQDDSITIKGKTVIQQKPPKMLLAFFKPPGVVATKQDKFADSTVLEYLPKTYQHFYPVGRLDKASRGLILMTNNGAFAQEMTHPKYNHEKEYIVEVISREKKSHEQLMNDISRLTNDIIDATAQSKPFKKASLLRKSPVKSVFIRITLTEGKKRQIRHILDKLGYDVVDLLRTRVGRYELEDLQEGEYRNITPADWQ